MLTGFRTAQRALLFATATWVLSACGGGGGSPASSPPPSGGFTLSTSSVTFSAKQSGQSPPNQTVSVHLTDSGSAKVGAGYKSGVMPPGWLEVTAAGSGVDYSFTLSVSTTALAAGSYSTTLTIGTSDASDNILETKDVQVSYSLKAGLIISTAPATVSAISGASLSTQSVAFTVTDAADAAWTASSNATWLIAPASGEAGNVSATVNTAGLKSGSYHGTVTLTNNTDSTDTATFSVNVTITLPVLTVGAPTLLLGGASGLDISTQPLTFAPGPLARAHSPGR